MTDCYLFLGSTIKSSFSFFEIYIFSDKILFYTDDAFFQPYWAGACWGRWAGPGLMLGWSAGFRCGFSLQK